MVLGLGLIVQTTFLDRTREVEREPGSHPYSCQQIWHASLAKITHRGHQLGHVLLVLITWHVPVTGGGTVERIQCQREG